MSKALRRLLRIRELEEEQGRLVLESAYEKLHQLNSSVIIMHEKEFDAQKILAESVHTGDVVDWLVGKEEASLARHATKVLNSQKEIAIDEVDIQREVFLERRMERRRTEILVDENLEQQKVVSERKMQSDLDDWHRFSQNSANRLSSQQEFEINSKN